MINFEIFLKCINYKMGSTCISKAHDKVDNQEFTENSHTIPFPELLNHEDENKIKLEEQ
jgi:hypothetical protein